MPNLQTIRRLSDPVEALRKYLRQLHNAGGGSRDIILYATDFVNPAPRMSSRFLAINHEDIQHFMTAISEMKGGNRRAKRARKLDLILHSLGGSGEVAEQIVNYLRAKYSHIRVIVPQNAMSAATMIACAADEIVMGRHSALGPTDPQFFLGDRAVAAQSVLNEFDFACETAKGAAYEIMKERIALWTPGLIDECSKEIELSNNVVGDWLCRYMKLPRKKAEEVAEKFADNNLSLTHGRPFNYDILKEWGVKVKLLESNQRFQDAVLSVFHAATAVFEKRNAFKLVVNHSGVGVFRCLEEDTDNANALT